MAVSITLRVGDIRGIWVEEKVGDAPPAHGPIQAAFVSDAPAVATVAQPATNPTGAYVTAVAVGDAIITATAGGQSATWNIRVIAADALTALASMVNPRPNE